MRNKLVGEDNTPRHLDKFYCGGTITLPNWGRMHHSVFFTDNYVCAIQGRVAEDIYYRPSTGETEK